MVFSGIPVGALDFYDDLEADNSKAFWTVNKIRYDRDVRDPIVALAAELESEFGAPKVFRPHRDVRFARDKTPYKTHQGVWFAESSCYFDVSAAGLRIAAGYWRTSPDQVARLRRSVDDELVGSALQRAVHDLVRKKFELHGNQITRVPPGFDKAHPRADLLRYKTLTVGKMLGFPDWLHDRRARTEIARSWRQTRALVEWLDTHVGGD